MALMRGKWIVMTAGGLVAAGGLAGSLLASCAQTPTNVPVQTFEQPKNMDVVCLNVFDPNGNPLIPAVPKPEAACAQVPPNTNGAALPNHLYALVTQTTRGEVAVVDLTAGSVVDVDPNTPGINFLPVGAVPSDIAATPDGRMVFVGSAAPNSPAIFGLPSTLILGDSQAADGGIAPGKHGAAVPALTTWPVCALPQAPGAIRVLPNAVSPLADGGAGSPAGYVIVAVLPGDSVHSAKVVTIDPAPFLRGGYGADAGLPDGGVDTPGYLTPCSYIDERPLELAPPQAGAGAAPAAGPAWDDGVKYVDGGLTADLPSTAATCATVDAGGASGTTPVTPAKPTAGATVLDTSGPRALLYVADTAFPMIHVVDLSDPTAPVEQSPLLATSVLDPKRVVSVGQIAVSPTTREFKRFLYAIDRTEGSILVYDVTDPVGGPRVPLTRPHPELNPFQPPDRLIFGTPVASVAFVQHDWPLVRNPRGPLTTAETGLLCNPNPNVNKPQGLFNDDGAYYRNANIAPLIPIGPARLRGVFAFATLSNGTVITIDVDDWDAPCRRPDPLAPPGALLALVPPSDAGIPVPAQTADQLLDGMFNAITPPEPDAGAGDFSAYHTPLAFQPDYTGSDSVVTLEWFFPVSAPHRPRSQYLLRNDPTNGNHAPYLVGRPQLIANGSPQATQGVQAVGNPMLVATDTTFVDPSIFSNPLAANPLTRTLATLPPGVRFAWEDPQVHSDQDWIVNYEGPLPGFFDNAGNPLVLANVIAQNALAKGGTVGGAAPDYSAVWLANKDANFCSKGIEDFSLGAQRATVQNQTLAASGLPSLPGFETQVADYVQLTDDILPVADQYWKVPNACWDADPKANQAQPADRNKLCNDVYGATLDPTTPSLQRDFPILEAHDDRLLISRFGYTGGPAARAPGSPSWTVVGPDPSNAKFLKLMQCCFHNQVHFRVRTGGQWATTGSSSSFLHHIEATGPDARCALSCEPRDALLNARAAPIPLPAASGDPCASTATIQPITRDSVLAMRNPMFSFLIWNGQVPGGKSGLRCVDRPPVRDMYWSFSTRGGFTSQALSLSTSGISPQSMRFIDSLGQLGIIDGSSLGLILIDLNTINLSHAPYF